MYARDKMNRLIDVWYDRLIEHEQIE